MENAHGKSNLCTPNEPNEPKRKTFSHSVAHTLQHRYIAEMAIATHQQIYSQFGWLNLRDFVFDFLLIRHFLWVFNRIYPEQNGDKVVFIIELRNDNHSTHTTHWIGVVIRNFGPFLLLLLRHEQHRTEKESRALFSSSNRIASYSAFFIANECSLFLFSQIILFRKWFNLFRLKAKKNEERKKTLSFVSLRCMTWNWI